MKPIDFHGKAWYVTDDLYNERTNYFQVVEVRSITPLNDHHATISYLGGKKIVLMDVDNPNLFNKVVDAEKQVIELNLSRARFYQRSAKLFEEELLRQQKELADETSCGTGVQEEGQSYLPDGCGG